MSFKVIKGAYRIEQLPVTATLALAEGTLLEWTSGYLAAADDNDTDVAGILAETIASTDDDYGTTGKRKGVIVPTEKHVLYEADTADTFVQATHGGVECGIVDSANIDLDDTSNDVFRPLYVGSTSLKVVGYLKVNGSF